ncbi:hypothetical protein PAXRUDRAFT_85701, partial [Paxillus rubicundulus Ve08.2h10]
MPENDWQQVIGNHLLAERLNYDQVEQPRQAEENIPCLNVEQCNAYDAIYDSVQRQAGITFFVCGPGGTGKTFLYNTLCCALLGQGKVVLCVASSGIISSLLLIGGCTAHSHFKIPLQLFENSTCGISKGTLLAQLIQAADAII